MSYGYGLSASLFQIAHAYTAFAHDGEVIPTVIGLSHPEQYALVERTCPEARDRCVVIGDPVTFGRLIGVAFDQVRQCADFHAPVYVHLLEALTRIAGCVTRPERMEPLLTEGRLVMEAACASVPSQEDRQGIEERYDELVTAASKG